MPVEEVSDDEDLGRIFANSSSNVKKFSGKATSEVANMLNAEKLLHESMSDLTKDLEKLIMYSASKQTWARHTSAWKMYADFCEHFKISFSLPIPVVQVQQIMLYFITYFFFLVS